MIHVMMLTTINFATMMVVTVVEPMSSNNIVLIVTASVSEIYIFVLNFAVVLSEFYLYLKLSACDPVSSSLACLHAGGASYLA